MPHPRPAVLVVEDDGPLRELLTSFLALEGYPVFAASTGVEALSCIEQGRPAVIVLDMHLPVMDGWALAAALHTRGIRIPIVVMTAAWRARQAAEEIDAAAYVPKPISLPQLLDRVDRLCA